MEEMKEKEREYAWVVFIFSYCHTFLTFLWGIRSVYGINVKKKKKGDSLAAEKKSCG